MAEFSEVMRQWKRMCNYYTERAGNDHDACAICKFEGNGSNCLAVYEDSEPDTAEVERVVMAWAAEHPEPVYETWFEYLLRIGVIPEDAPAGGEYQWIVESIKHKHISNDIAESLNLHPKEAQA